jgi:inner membrane protein
MDTLTHALSGALIARATAARGATREEVRRRVAAGFLVCAAPDLDIVFAFFGQLDYLTNHRGITHSVVLLPLWALLLSWLLAKILREPRGWRALYGVSALAIGVHIAGDVITTFGTMVLAPLSDWRAAIGTTFIIDLWFSGIIVVGLAASLLWRKRRLPAIAATAVLLAYVGAQAVLRGEAEQFGAKYAASLGLAHAQVDVQPQPLSPFNWMVFVSDDAAHRYARVNLLRKQPLPEASDAGFFARIEAVYRPLSFARWVTRPRFGATAEEQALARDAWGSPALAFFRWFAELPAFDGITQGSTCVWFVDLRFATPGRDAMPFRYGACRKPGEPWRAYRRSGDDRPAPLD